MKKIMLTVAAACALASYAAPAKKLPVWANNNLGMEAVGNDYIDPDHAPIQVNGNTVTSGFKSLVLDKFGLPQAVKVKNFDVLKYPVRLEFEDDRMQLRLRPDQFSVKKDGKNSAVSVAEFASAGVKFKITARFDFDFTIHYKMELSPEKGKVNVHKLALVFPMNTPAQEEKLVMYYREGPNRPESGREAQKRRAHLTIKGGDYRAIEPGFCSLFWIGTTEGGLSWNFPSAIDWNPIKGYEMTYDPGTGNYALNIIQKPIILDKTRTIEFYLTPTPVREMPKNWRTWNYGWRGTPVQKHRKGVNQLVWWSSVWRAGGYDPQRVRNPEETKAAAAADKGMNKANYYIPQLISGKTLYENADGDIFLWEDEYLDALAEKYHRAPGMKGRKLDIPEDVIRITDIKDLRAKLGTGNYDGKYRMISRNWDSVFVKPLADHMVWALNDFIKLGVGGIYYDGINPQANYSAWAAWTDPNGDLRPRFFFKEQRDLLKRMRYLVKKADPNEMVVAHQSGTRPASTLSLCDVIIPGETFFYGYHEPNKRDASPNGDFYYAYIVGDIDNLKGEFYYKQWGVPHVLLPECRGKNGKTFPGFKATRTMLAYTLHFDMLYFPTMCQVQEIYKIYNIRDRFGMADVEFKPYWENRTFRPKEKNFKASYYYKTGKKEYMLIVSNLQFGDASSVIRLPKGIKSITEMQSNKEIAVKNNEFTADLGPYEFGIYHVKGE